MHIIHYQIYLDKSIYMLYFMKLRSIIWTRLKLTAAKHARCTGRVRPSGTGVRRAMRISAAPSATISRPAQRSPKKKRINKVLSLPLAILPTGSALQKNPDNAAEQKKRPRRNKYPEPIDI